MELFAFTFNHHHFALVGSSWSGWEELYVDGVIVSQRRNFGFNSVHSFELDGAEGYELEFTIDAYAGHINYELRLAEAVLLQGQAPLAAGFKLARVHAGEEGQAEAVSAADAPGATPASKQVPRKNNHWIVLAGVGFKLLKSAKVFKAGLAAASLSVYSILFSVEFALALIAILIFHEYGHLRAMKKFGIPTKGMYLIPFVGGLAVGDKPRSRWQDVYISLMGPIYGLLMTIVFYLAYLFTDNHFVGLVASMSALINIFNLLPIYPLDGGRVVKSLVFSGRSYLALIFLLTLSAVFFALSFKLGFALIGFFIVLGVIDILSEWRTSLAEDITPLNRYGVGFCLAWYLLVVGAFLGIIVLIANSGLPGSEIALLMLNS
jgi:putative peptide zinc metalloprotease protein